MTEQREQTTEQDLAREAQEAVARADRLARRLGSIREEIHQKREGVRHERVRAAKRGDDVLGAGDRDEVARLEEERDELPERLFAARLQAAGAHLRLEQHRAEEAEKRIPDARLEYDRLAAYAAEAEARAEEARARLVSLESEQRISLERRQAHVRLLERLEERGVQDAGSL